MRKARLSATIKPTQIYMIVTKDIDNDGSTDSDIVQPTITADEIGRKFTTVGAIVVSVITTYAGYSYSHTQELVGVDTFTVVRVLTDIGVLIWQERPVI
ncbi:hypothetical protein CHS0354_022205 [Potamilus streckersoni]|uniref:Uncharacterized protein n=1 Tax=Potamilus streckersoni TaxID=2493646 RepID=A0AAE0W6P6_9BIVA|nr:hypothetical protein CHS0354_022205 [Potamilus streckersoni]